MDLLSNMQLIPACTVPSQGANHIAAAGDRDILYPSREMAGSDLYQLVDTDPPW